MSQLDFIRRSTDQVLSGRPLSEEAGLRLLSTEGPDLGDLMAAANRVRHHFKGDRVHLCAIINAKSGRCPEDCGFCVQSIHSKSQLKTHPILSADELFEAARAVQATGAHAVGIVTSGLTVSDLELDVICRTVARIRKELSIRPDASLGMLDDWRARRLKEAGLCGYHHNVETARSFFPKVCTTHSYDEHLATLAVARKAGFHICSGGIFGLGETPDQQVEMAETLRQVSPDRVCLNFLMPIAGTRLAGAKSMRALEILRLIAVYRMMLPDKDINICAGRDLYLGQVQGMIFFAGANATMIGNYLTQPGRPADLDLALLKSLELNVDPSGTS